MSSGFQGTQKEVAGFEGAVAAILDYTGALDNLIGSGGLGMSSFISSFLTVGLMDMIGRKIIKNNPGTNKVSLVHPLTAGIYSGVLAMIFNGILGSRIQNPKILSATGTFLGTYMAEKDYDPSS